MHIIVLQTPESPLKEEWVWLTDLLPSYDGHEDRIPLNKYPKRVFSGTYEFDRIKDINWQRALMQARFGRTFLFPLYQYQTKLKAPAIVGASSVLVNAMRSDLRAARAALIVEGDTWELVVVDAVAADAVTFVEPLENAYSVRAQLMPVVEVFTPSGASVAQRNTDDSASMTFRYMELIPWSPFLSPLNDTALTMFDGKVVLDLPGLGIQFDTMAETGIRITEYIGLPDIVSPWDQAQWTSPLRFLNNRVWDLSSWLWWSAFADHVQGSNVPFLVPTHRADLTIVTPVAGSGALVTVEGTEYSDHYWPLDTFKRVVIDSDAGRHYALVTAVNQVGGNDRLTLSPALPAGTGWTNNQKLSFLLKVRIADDKITCDHYGLQTEVSMTLRTVT